MRSETWRRWGIQALMACTLLTAIAGRTASATIITDPPGDSLLGPLGAGTTTVVATVGGDCEAFSGGGLLCGGEILDFRLDLPDDFILTSIQATLNDIVAGPAGMTVRFLTVPPDLPVDFEIALAEGGSQTVFSGSFGGPATIGRFFTSLGNMSGADDGTVWAYTASYTFEVAQAPSTVPEPATALLLGASLIGCVAVRRRARRHSVIRSFG